MSTPPKSPGQKLLGRPGEFPERKDLTVTIDHVRAAGLCVHGARTWFARHDLDFRTFLERGIEAGRILATGDAMAQRVVDVARRKIEEPR